MRMRLGLAQALIPTHPADFTPELAAEIASLGVSTIMTHFQVPPSTMIGERGSEIRSILEEAELDICACAGLRPDLVTPDQDARRTSIAALHDLMHAARTLGAPMITAGCGSHNPTHQYGPAAANHTEEARARLVASLYERTTTRSISSVRSKRCTTRLHSRSMPARRLARGSRLAPTSKTRWWKLSSSSRSRKPHPARESWTSPACLRPASSCLNQAH